MPRSFAYRASAALIATFIFAACTGENLPTDPESSESASAGAPAAAAPAVDMPNLVGNSWAATAVMPTARSGLTAATVNGIVYAIGGGGASEYAMATVEAYDPQFSLFPWKTMAPLPSPRSAPNGSGVINGKIYVPGGMNAAGSPTRSLFVFNPATNAWTTKAQMPVASAGGAAGVIGGKLYVIATPGLMDAAHSRLFRYDPGTNTWTERASPPDNLVGATVGVMNGKLFAAGGVTPQETLMNKLSVYNPATNRWTTRAPMPTPRWVAAGGVIGGKLYVAGGVDAGGQSAKTEVYDLQTNTWATKANMPAPRHSPAAAVANGRLYVLGGATDAASANNSNYVYTP